MSPTTASASTFLRPPRLYALLALLLTACALSSPQSPATYSAVYPDATISDTQATLRTNSQDFGPTTLTANASASDLTLNVASGSGLHTPGVVLIRDEAIKISGKSGTTLTVDSIGPLTINDCSNTSPIEVTTSTAHGRTNADRVTITGATGNTNCNVTANPINITSDTTFELVGVAGNGAYTGNGAWSSNGRGWDGTTAASHIAGRVVRAYTTAGQYNQLLREVQALESAVIGGSSLPVVDTTSVVEGSVDDTKEIRFEVDGLTTGTVRVLTPPDADINLPGTNITNTWTATQNTQTLLPSSGNTYSLGNVSGSTDLSYLDAYLRDVKATRVRVGIVDPVSGYVNYHRWEFGASLNLSVIENSSGDSVLKFNSVTDGDEHVDVKGKFRIEAENASVFTELERPTTGSSYDVILPDAQGTGALTNDGAGNLSWSAGGGFTCTTANDCMNLSSSQTVASPAVKAFADGATLRFASNYDVFYNSSNQELRFSTTGGGQIMEFEGTTSRVNYFWDVFGTGLDLGSTALRWSNGYFNNLWTGSLEANNGTISGNSTYSRDITFTTDGASDIGTSSVAPFNTYSENLILGQPSSRTGDLTLYSNAASDDAVIRGSHIGGGIVNVEVDSPIMPETSSVTDLGLATRRWANTYTDNLQLAAECDISVVSSAPGGACNTCDIRLNQLGGSGTTLYVCEGGSWAAK